MLKRKVRIKKTMRSKKRISFILPIMLPKNPCGAGRLFFFRQSVEFMNIILVWLAFYRYNCLCSNAYTITNFDSLKKINRIYSFSIHRNFKMQVGAAMVAKFRANITGHSNFANHLVSIYFLSYMNTHAIQMSVSR